jgi:hypothetical protein
MIWTVIGELGAVLDLEEPLILDDFRVGNKPPHPVPRTRFGITPEVESSGWILRSTAVPEFHTGLYFWTLVDEKLSEDAIARVERKLPRLTASMSLAVGESVQAVVAVAYYDNGYVEPGANSQFTLLEDTSIAAEVALYVWAALEETVPDAVTHLYRGRQLLSTPSRTPNLQQDAAILEFAKVVEGIAQEHGSSEVAPEELDGAAQSIVDKCTKALTSEVGVRKKAASIRSARDELLRLDNSFLNLKVASTLSQFGLSGPWEIVSKHLLEARNKKLAHPGENLSQRERDGLLSGTEQAPSAEALAEALLARSLGVAPDDIPSMRRYSAPAPPGGRKVQYPPPTMGAPVAVELPGGSGQAFEATFSIPRRTRDSNPRSPS